MMRNRAKSLIAALSLVIMLLVGVATTTAQAQSRNRAISRHRPIIVYRYRPYWGPRLGWRYDPFWNPTITVVDPIAQQRELGYSDGHKRGKDDAKHEKPYSPESHKHYRDSDSLTYRQAFLQGYADGYREQAGEPG